MTSAGVTGVLASEQVLAHGIGGRQDLPIPFEYALGGAVIALAATFFVLARAWPQSRFHGGAAGRPLPAALAAIIDARLTRLALRLAGLLGGVWIGIHLIFGQPLGRDNPGPGALYAVMWVCVPLLSVVVGPVWRLISPVRTIHAALARMSGQDPEQGMRELPQRWGYWPAVVALLAFLWLELVAPERATIPVVGLAFGTYLMVTLLGALLFGSRWLATADPFEVYSSLAARLAPIGRRDDGTLVLRNPLDGLDSTPIRPGLAAVVIVLLGSTAFDSLSNATGWVQMVQESGAPTMISTAGLFGCIVIIGGLYAAAVALSGNVAGERGRLPGIFAHSILPIALGYMVAHYYSLAVLEGQRTIQLAAHLPSRNVADAADAVPSYAVVTPAIVATLQVVAVLAGHIVGAIAAHDRAVRVFPRAHALAGQFPLLLLMVVYTYVGLTLLFAT